ncbi:hypothetical protein J8I87_14895 [Paraburkholderia sp. LEh10]|uniref:hypothetical protein n=1 Tax=Paraburkholderia sp. LEh10 TaxID=2821353 RepID=UPI001AEAABA7|nr:hypothetical protein [Paraburkholderia sp. LEh10]MBP0590975.1 hypothetical protein [Paraburkholderia sp. LEh10]
MMSYVRFAVLFFGLAISTLVSHGAYMQMVGIIILSIYCLSSEKIRREIFERDTVLAVAIVMAIITAFFLYFIAFTPPNCAPALVKSALNNYLFLGLVTLYVVCLRATMKVEAEKIISALSALIIVNVLILLLQTVVLIASNTYIDFVEPVTGEMSRYHNYENLNPVFAFRPTGLYVEPSTFSAALAVMTIGYLLLCRAQKRDPHFLPVILSIIAMLITQSTAAVVQCALLLVAIMSNRTKSTRAIIAVLLVGGLVAAPSFIEAYLDSFTTKMSESSELRLALMDFIYHQRSGWDWLLGYGPFALEDPLYRLTDTGGKYQVASLNDAGLLQYFVVRFGMLGFAIPVLFFIRVRKDIPHLLFLVILLTVKLSYAEPVLYIGLLPLLMRLPKQANASIRQPEAESPGSLDDIAMGHPPYPTQRT